MMEPFLDALSRLREREVLSPAEVVTRSRALLEQQFGTSMAVDEAAFAHGPIGLSSEHTHYFDGFALLMPLPHGTGVAARVREEGPSRVIFGGSQATWSFDRGAAAEGERGMPDWVRTAIGIVRALAPDGVEVELAVASTVPPGCRSGYLSALAVALVRTMQALFALSESRERLLRCIQDVLSQSTGRPFSIAYPMAATAANADDMMVVDTVTLEQLPVGRIASDIVGWGLVDVSGSAQEPSVYRKRYSQTEKVLGQLRENGFDELGSLRELEHRHLRRALSVLPPPLRPVLRYLVTENRRVQKLIGALRRSDGQLLGALLLMGHAALRDDWEGSSEEADLVVGQIEAMSIEGMYGARQVEPGGVVLVVGQPFTVPSSLDQITTAFEDHFGSTPGTMLL